MDNQLFCDGDRMHYEFEPDRSRKGRNKYIGSWTESDCRAIPLPFTNDSLYQVLDWGSLSSGSPFTHQEIARWCDRMHMAYMDVDVVPKMESAIRVAADVDCQWNLFLANTYSLEQLRDLDYSSVRLPVDWFVDWRTQLRDTEPRVAPDRGGI